MGKNKVDVNSIVSLMSILALVFLAPYGYTKTSQAAGSEILPAPLPVYKKGTTFIYSDGTWETVTGISQGQVAWRNYRGMVSNGSPDFTHRRTNWQTKTGQVSRQFGPRKDLWIKKKTSLWPLQIGNVASYSETSIWRRKEEPEETSQYNWTCEVAGTERVSVMAGEFDSWKIVCKRYPGAKVSSKSRIREQKTWYYAPEVGHYVLTASKSFLAGTCAIAYSFRKPAARFNAF